MNSKENQILFQLLNEPENSSNISALLSLIPDLPDESLRNILKTIHQELFSNFNHAKQLQCIRILKYLSILKNSYIISRINQKFLPDFLSLFSFTQDISKFNLWIESRQNREKSLFKLTILTLQCIETWHEAYRLDYKGNLSNFSIIFNKLKDQKVEFPPSFFLKVVEPLSKKHYKKDLSKVKRFNKEFEVLMSEKSVIKVKLLKKILASYEKTLDFHLAYLKEKKAEPEESFSSVHSKIKELNFKFLLWKSTDFSELISSKNKVPCLVPDPLPKIEPENEVPRESNKDLSSSNSSLCDFEEIKENFEHKASLSLMYKQDLSILQYKYIKLTEEKEIFSFKNAALEIQAKDLVQVIADQKTIIEEFRAENSGLLKKYESMAELNDFLSTKIEELNHNLDKMERSKLSDSRAIENLGNNNELLLLLNQELKEEIEKLRKSQESLKEIIKNLETRTDDFIENPESVKVSQNLSIGSNANRSNFIRSERSCLNLSSIDTVTEFDIYDNENLYFNFLIKGKGLIFEDNNLKISTLFEKTEKNVEGVLKILNKTESKLKIYLEIFTCPKELEQFSIPTGNFKIKASEEIEIKLICVCSKVFFGSPILKITYGSMLQIRFIKIPVNFLMFLYKTEKVSNEKKQFCFKKDLNLNPSQWKKVKKNFRLFGTKIKPCKENENKIKAGLSYFAGDLSLKFAYEFGVLSIKAKGTTKNAPILVIQSLSMLISKISIL